MKETLKTFLTFFFLLFSIKISYAAVYVSEKDKVFLKGGVESQQGFSIFFDNLRIIIILILLIYILLAYFFRREKISKKVKKIVNIILLTLVSFFILWQSYGFFIDIYNFNQLEKFKIILNDVKKCDKQFYNIKEFNEIYKSDIKAIKNCYYISNYNGKESYIFGFKLESFIYMYIYGTKYYAYPKYDIPYRSMCLMGRGCYDGNKEEFEYLISNPCK